MRAAHAAAILVVVPLFLGAQNIRYAISPAFSGDAPSLHIQMTFVGEADGCTEIALPGDFGSSEKRFRAVQNLDCRGGKWQFSPDGDSSLAIVQHRPDADILLEYDLSNAVLSTKTALCPIIERDFFCALGSSLFLVPQNFDVYDVQIDWQNFPPDWALHNSFGSGQTTQRFRFPSQKWLESVFIGGDFRITQTFAGEKPMFLAMRGSAWPLADDALLSILHRNLVAQCSYWQDFDVPYYTTILLPFAAADTTFRYLGMGLCNSFVAFVDTDKPLKISDFQHLFAHELTHYWLGGKIQRGGATNDMVYSWFSEGFAEYLAYQSLLRAGFMSPAEFVDVLNRDFFNAHHASPVGEVPDIEIQRNFFKAPEVSKLPYTRGCLFAFYLDNAIKTRSLGKQTLRDFMREALAYFREDERFLAEEFEFFAKNMGKYLRTGDFEQFYQQHIVEGHFIPAEKFVLPNYLEMAVKTNGTPHLLITAGHENEAWQLGN